MYRIFEPRRPKSSNASVIWWLGGLAQVHIVVPAGDFQIVTLKTKTDLQEMLF